MTEAAVTAPKVGKWNKYNKQRKEAKFAAKKRNLSKAERREKYTGIARDRQLRKNNMDLICYHCRLQGHAAQHCPKAQHNGMATLCCYRCGSTEHALSACPKGGTALPFATCFVCTKKGHLASACPQNANGIYVNGGACRHCGSKEHRGNACPEANEEKHSGRVQEQDLSDLLEGTPGSSIEKKKSESKTDGRRVVNF